MYDQERRDALKPLRVQNEITSAKIGKKKGNLQVVSKRFKTRVMRMQDEQVSHAVFAVYQRSQLNLCHSTSRSLILSTIAKLPSEAKPPKSTDAPRL